LQVTVPFAIFILPPRAECANLRCGVLWDDSSGQCEKLLGRGGLPRDSSTEAVPQCGVRGKPLTLAGRIIPDARFPLRLHSPLSLPAGGRPLSLVGVGQPSPSSRFAFKDHYPDSLAKLFRIIRFGQFAIEWLGRDDY